MRIQKTAAVAVSLRSQNTERLGTDRVNMPDKTKVATDVCHKQQCQLPFPSVPATQKNSRCPSRKKGINNAVARSAVHTPTLVATAIRGPASGVRDKRPFHRPSMEPTLRDTSSKDGQQLSETEPSHRQQYPLPPSCAPLDMHHSSTGGPPYLPDTSQALTFMHPDRCDRHLVSLHTA
jgi:hypothetical protein